MSGATLKTIAQWLRQKFCKHGPIGVESFELIEQEMGKYPYRVETCISCGKVLMRYFHA